MSNRNPLQTSINPLVNPTFKGNASVEGILTVGTTVNSFTVNSTNINVGGTVTTNNLVAQTTAQLPTDTLVGISSPNLMTFGGSVPKLDDPGTITYFVAPRGGTILGIAACPQAAITSFDATLTASINGVTITDGVITLPVVNSAPGKPAYAVPLALNVVQSDDIISITVGGANDAITSADVRFTLQYD